MTDKTDLTQEVVNWAQRHGYGRSVNNPDLSRFGEETTIFSPHDPGNACEDCICRIEVGATPVTPTNAWHTFVVFTDASGNKTLFRGGPQTNNPFSKKLSDDLRSGVVSDIIEEPHGGAKYNDIMFDIYNDAIWGNLTVHRAPFRPGYPDYDNWEKTGLKLTFVSQGRETCRKYSSLIVTSAKIARGGYQYGPFGHNCNRATTTWLKEAGVLLKKPPVWAPRFGDPLW